jgi:uncharacterized membrane protein/uncharacterized lipoprotein NlpE involved in copper resistance
MKWLSPLSILIFLGCNAREEKKAEVLKADTTTNVPVMIDSQATASDTVIITQVNSRSPVGFYQVRLPCHDCKSLQHTIAFRPDKTYTLEEEKKGTNDQFSITKGNWTTTNNIVSIYKGELVVGQYKWKANRLVYIQPARDYPLTRLSAARENEVWRNRKNSGIRFFGVGNEPFWNIEIDGNKAISFHAADWSGPIDFKLSRAIIAGDSIVYNTSNDSATLQVIIYNKFCNDGMSDFIYDNKVKVIYNSIIYTGCGLLYK